MAIRKRGHRRAVIVRGSRSYVVCGLRPRRRPSRRRFGWALVWIPGAGALIGALFSGYLAVWSPRFIPDQPPAGPMDSIARYTIEDFVKANH
jgi:hypothetical protein